MGASPIVCAYYSEAIERFGEPSGSYAFYDPPPPDDSWPQRIDVLYWENDAELDITTFSTVGMCDRPMSHVDHRCELHFSIRKPAREMNLNRVCAFCANLATYPFANDTFFDWTQTVVSPGAIPYFPNCRSLLLHPAFVADGWDTVMFGETKIQIMNLVPLTEREMSYRKEHGPFAIYNYLVEKAIDLFRDRTD
jgi:hypothetical protein